MSAFAESLLDAEAVECVLLDKTTVQNDVGGVTTVYKDGAHFMATFDFKDSIRARVAQQEGMKSVFSVFTSKKIVMRNFDVFRRVKDGQVFRVTSNGDDQKTPSCSTLNRRKVAAEEWKV